MFKYILAIGAIAVLAAGCGLSKAQIINKNCMKHQGFHHIEVINNIDAADYTGGLLRVVCHDGYVFAIKTSK